MTDTPRRDRRRWLRALHRLEDGLLALMLTGMILLAAAQIVLRNLFSSGISWGEPLLRILVLWLALLGAMAATRDRNHIRIDLLPRVLPRSWYRPMRRLTNAFSAAICGLVAWHGGRFVHFEWQDGTLLFAAIPIWIFELIIPLGFGVMTLRFLLQSISDPDHPRP
jgi:TRAP-type C4-dicarboxylate transport system permease small subunit